MCMKRKKVFIALKMSGIAGQAKLAGIFRYLNKKYNDNSIWEYIWFAQGMILRKHPLPMPSKTTPMDLSCRFRM